tara:strand:+ start:71 stop:1126 length:1056 start_codon:yes stop_codon:yes gene_type:complete
MIRKIINCISIHQGGGIIYLTMMHSDLDKKDNLILLDNRAKGNLKTFKYAKFKYYKRGLFRNLFIFLERIKTTIIFRRYLNRTKKKEYLNEYYLNGIPPLFRFPLRTNRVFIFCQNKNIYKFINYFDKKLFFKIKFYIYNVLHIFLINNFLRDSDTLFVQTSSMKKCITNLKPKNKILIKDHYWKNLSIDFFNFNLNERDNNFKDNEIIELERIAKSNKLFFYPASFDPHKNHKILFNVFNNLSKNSFNNIKLIVTLNSNHIPKKYKSNNQIIFIGKQNHSNINKIYKIADFLIFPSLNESLGLPLIEAKLNNLPIISSDLDYVYDVCIPIFTFNPYSEEDIYSKIVKSLV